MQCLAKYYKLDNRDETRPPKMSVFASFDSKIYNITHLFSSAIIIRVTQNRVIKNDILQASTSSIIR